MQTAANLSTDAVTVHKWYPAYPVAQRYVIRFCGFWRYRSVRRGWRDTKVAECATRLKYRGRIVI